MSRTKERGGDDVCFSHLRCLVSCFSVGTESLQNEILYILSEGRIERQPVLGESSLGLFILTIDKYSRKARVRV
jgi:hypothetical protein